jgi:hypothetical protein
MPDKLEQVSIRVKKAQAAHPEVAPEARPDDLAR